MNMGFISLNLKKNSSGFTIIELLIALLIAGIVGAIVYKVTGAGVTNAVKVKSCMVEIVSLKKEIDNLISTRQAIILNDISADIQTMVSSKKSPFNTAYSITVNNASITISVDATTNASASDLETALSQWADSNSASVSRSSTIVSVTINYD